MSDRPPSPELEASTIALNERRTELLGEQIHRTQIESRIAELNLKDVQEQHHTHDASPAVQRVTTFYGGVGNASAVDIISTFGQWARLDAGIPPAERRPYQLNICSPGGSVIDGFAIIDYLRDLQAQGYVINTHAIGFVASMGGVILQAGNERTISPNAYMLIHEVSDIAMGSMGALEDSVDFAKRLNERCRQILNERSTIAPATFTRKWTRKDWWLSADEVVKYGFADRISDVPEYVAGD